MGPQLQHPSPQTPSHSLSHTPRLLLIYMDNSNHVPHFGILALLSEPIIVSYILVYFFCSAIRALIIHLDLPFTGCLRSFIADYGVPLMVIVWTALSYTLPSKVLSGVPRRLLSPLPWESSSLGHWTIVEVISQLFTILRCKC